MTPEEKILTALSVKALYRKELAKIIGMDDLRAMGILKRMREAGEIRVDGYGKYERAHGGYCPDGWPGPQGAA